MASRFSNAKIVSSFIANTVCPVVTRRGYVAASSVRGGAVAPNMILKKGIDESTKTSWVPDPVTGYYRPENEAKEIDAAELRAQLLKNTTSSH
ncbi:SENESCENCE-ASSOCIATED GENE 21, mitochondrial-like [Olea europaea subsp. europaea]|uniref:SENESCENCE-ASSOCIATED GENE 21, mitochondrial-like n=2 Tax=Olea europaea TaxID=4146 RepID=A0A8S0RVF0_OLEEU|nr:SENESCENCE-ASSOCIATED GENE 21, mitochondrial-like [Olea europaea subsp. europaea]